MTEYSCLDFCDPILYSVIFQFPNLFFNNFRITLLEQLLKKPKTIFLFILTMLMLDYNRMVRYLPVSQKWVLYKSCNNSKLQKYKVDKHFIYPSATGLFPPKTGNLTNSAYKVSTPKAFWRCSGWEKLKSR
jgi:hypothetical protein